MKEKIERINQDINHVLGLMSTYPYLSDNLNQVVDKLKVQKEQLEELNSLEDLSDYEGPDFNKIDKKVDDLGVVKAKLQAQQAWIDKNKK